MVYQISRLQLTEMMNKHDDEQVMNKHDDKCADAAASCLSADAGRKSRRTSRLGLTPGNYPEFNSG